jgi:hypothetical protein
VHEPEVPIASSNLVAKRGRGASGIFQRIEVTRPHELRRVKRQQWIARRGDCVLQEGAGDRMGQPAVAAQIIGLETPRTNETVRIDAGTPQGAFEGHQETGRKCRAFHAALACWNAARGATDFAFVDAKPPDLTASLRDVSQVLAAARSCLGEGLVGQSIEASRHDVILDLTIPALGVEGSKPRAKRRELPTSLPTRREPSGHRARTPAFRLRRTTTRLANITAEVRAASAERMRFPGLLQT